MGYYIDNLEDGAVALVHVAFGVGLGAHVWWGLFLGVGGPLVHVGQGHGVLLVDVALKLGLQAGPMTVGEGQGDEGLGLAHKLVNVALPCHLLHNSLLVVITQRATELVIVHGWTVLLHAPEPGHLRRDGTREGGREKSERWLHLGLFSSRPSALHR